MNPQPLTPLETIKRKLSLPFKITLIGILMLILLIPIEMIINLIHERQSRANEAKHEILTNGGNTQTLRGPYLVIPYIEKNLKWDPQVQAKVQVDETFEKWISPEELKIEGSLTPDVRRRGIFSAVLYGGRFDLEGKFTGISLKEWGLEGKSIDWTKVHFLLYLTNPRGLQKNAVLHFGSAEIKFKPQGLGENEAYLTAPLPNLEENLNAQAWTFKIQLDLKGGESLNFLPSAIENQIHLTSSWAHPKFIGRHLPSPSESKVTDKGFDTTWRLTKLTDTPSESFGVQLILPVDVYQMATRSAKYALLFILLTYSTFFLFEILNHLRIHPIQYLLVGISLCLFYLTLLSLSEHFPFGISYLIASLANIGLISFYSASVLKAKSKALIMTGILSLQYAYLYLLLRSEDFSLLFGSIALFLILAFTMYLTRKIDWYSIGEPKEENIPTPSSPRSL